MGDRNVLERILSGLEKPTDLALALLQEITQNFSEQRKIGEGGFGEVYKGVLQISIVVVKRIIVSEHTVDDMLLDREVKNLMTIIISPQNVVHFLGFFSNTHCEAIKFPGSADFVFAEKRERLLCFECISNRSLDKHRD
uniref:Protein kinase domain-containing protein n=1 Tax=Triticum urartu TaxID=4572 RepID=A0A8R7PYC5_TRIUA